MKESTEIELRVWWYRVLHMLVGIWLTPLAMAVMGLAIWWCDWRELQERAERDTGRRRYIASRRIEW